VSSFSFTSGFYVSPPDESGGYVQASPTGLLGNTAAHIRCARLNYQYACKNNLNIAFHGDLSINMMAVVPTLKSISPSAQ
jgi:hypothetical protein